jgi:Ice-binding-like/Putative Ig domain
MKLRSLTFSAITASATLLSLSGPASAQSILKTAGNYSVLASQAITVAGAGFTIKNGNIGLYPAATSNITGFPPGTVSGITLLGTAAAIISTGGATQQAEADLQVASTGLAAMTPNANYSNVDMANLGALPPGVYKWNAAATLTGALVLDAQGRNNVSWVFQFGTGLTTAINSSVTLINPGSNGGSDDAIFWNAATGAIVIGNNNTVLGNYIAYTSISFTGSTSLLGGGGDRFLALNASVTFAGPGTVSATGGPGGSDWTAALTLSGTSVVASTGGGSGGTGGSGGAGSPVITSPNIASGTAGSSVSYTISATGTPTSYTATGLPPGLVLNAATGAITGTATASGTFTTTITATNSSGSSSSTVTFSIASQQYARIANFSARAVSGVGSNTLIIGFYVSGNGKSLLVRGDGPILSTYGITSPLADPMLTLNNSSGMMATNSAWQTGSGGVAQGPLITSTDTQVGAFALPSGSLDTALMATVNQGVYTAVILSPNGTSGVALAEVYDADVSQTPVARITAISARMNVTAGQGVLIGGFVIEGNIPQTVLIRGVGPALTSYGVTGVLSDPVITVLSGSTTLATNAGWGTGTSSAAQLSAAAVQVGAFPLPSGSKDSAVLLTLQPGAYTVEVSSASGATGVALVEVYDTQ